MTKLLQLVQVICFFLGTPGEGSELSSWRGEDCAIDGYTNTKITQQDSGEFVCCVALTCPQGTFAVACTESDPSSTKCKECEGDTFMDKESLSTDSLKCIPRRPCLAQRGLLRSYEGSIVKDAVCQCDLERGYYDPEGIKNPAYCGGPKPCPAGEELTMDGNCSLCGPGMFKASEDITRCQDWTPCEMLGLISELGNRTADATCVTGITTVALTEMHTTDSEIMKEPRPDPHGVIIPVVVVLLSVTFAVVCCLLYWRRKQCKRMFWKLVSCRCHTLSDDLEKECQPIHGAELSPPSTSLVDSKEGNSEDPEKERKQVHVPLEQVPLVSPRGGDNKADETGRGNGNSQAQCPEELSTDTESRPSTRSLPSVNLDEAEGNLEVDADADKLRSYGLRGTLGPPTVCLAANPKQLDQSRDRSADRRNWFSVA